jgi:hypothetical protein
MGSCAAKCTVSCCYGRTDPRPEGTRHTSRAVIDRELATLAFSKKLDNFKAAIALYLAYYNLVKIHGSLRCTPAMEAGIENSAWKVSDW